MSLEPDTIDLAMHVGEGLCADMYLYAGPITRTSLQQFKDEINPTRKNAVLILETYGGDADAAYWMVRCLRNCYQEGNLTFLLDGLCKSAGTLMAIGANVLIMSDNAELGPLDVQLAKPDEVGVYYSGLSAAQALKVLRTESNEVFWNHFVSVLRNTRFQITTRTAAELATKLCIGLLEPVYAQIDPIRLGENQRSIEIAHKYGLELRTENISEWSVWRLVTEFPSHSYVIDKSSARNLFENVIDTTPKQEELLAKLRPIAKFGLGSDSPTIEHLTASQEAPNAESSEGVEDGRIHEGSETVADTGHPQRVESSTREQEASTED